MNFALSAAAENPTTCIRTIKRALNIFNSLSLEEGMSSLRLAFPAILYRRSVKRNDGVIPLAPSVGGSIDLSDRPSRSRPGSLVASPVPEKRPCEPDLETRVQDEAAAGRLGASVADGRANSRWRFFELGHSFGFLRRSSHSAIWRQDGRLRKAHWAP